MCLCLLFYSCLFVFDRYLVSEFDVIPFFIFRWLESIGKSMQGPTPLQRTT